MQSLTGIQTLADAYDGFIIDLWGVIHDGVQPYPGAVHGLAQLQKHGKRVVLLSNAPRRAAVAQARLRELGIADDLYTGIITSGEATFLTLRDGSIAWAASLGPRVFHLGPARDQNVLATLPYVTCDVETADWVLNTGPDDDAGAGTLEEHLPVLDACAMRRLPMLCANPDLEVVRDGERLVCAGALAQYYQHIGGIVHFIGKPDPTIYDPVFAILKLPRARVLAVGDSLRTDIAGANAVEIDACWVLGGIHHHEEDPAEAARQATCSARYSVSGFRWSGPTG